jgi:hypothetical protein
LPHTPQSPKIRVLQSLLFDRSNVLSHNPFAFPIHARALLPIGTEEHAARSQYLDPSSFLSGALLLVGALIGGGCCQAVALLGMQLRSLSA